MRMRLMQLGHSLLHFGAKCGIRLSIIGFTCSASYSSDSLLLEDVVRANESRLDSIEKSLSELQLQNASQYGNVFTEIHKLDEALRNEVQSINDTIQSLRDSLRLMYIDLEANVKPQQRHDQGVLSAMQSRLSSTRFQLYLYASIFVLLLTLGLIFAFRWFSKLKLQESTILLDTKLSEILEKQLAQAGGLAASQVVSFPDVDHSLPARVGEEIFRMRKRTASMDPETKGLGALNNALARLEDEFNRRGYAIVDLTGSNYDDGMTVKVANIIERTDIDAGQQVVSRMISPQILFNGKLVNPGEIELAVSTNRKAAQEQK